MDGLWPVVRAAAIAAFTVGVLLMLLKPPSLSGAGGLALIAVSTVAFVILVAWAFAAMTGREAVSEAEFERIVQRSEALARIDRPGGAEPTDFELLVADAIDRLPGEFQRLLETTPVVVSNRGAEAGAYGHYFGDTIARGEREQRIVVYQDTLERDFGFDPDLLAAQVERTLRHEVAHLLGWDEGGVRGLGL
jgi:predicted Zn-dependent protease with MMP-like domain